ncbi:MAG TPA: 50S ribosomal protein L11 methyltransferase [Desulfobulbus sp.]|nr:50S ribosomal protein L11 methyltransferase [Desulfobulbus sp.]
MDEKNTESVGKKWLKLSLQTPSRLVESVSDMLGVLSGSGVEISPETESGSLISGFFPVEEGADVEGVISSARPVLEELFQLYAQPVPEMQTEIIDDQDWATSWKRFFPPIEIVPGLIIKPSWEDYQARGNEKVIEMDPGQAFGTGQHASTRMALSLLTTGLSDQPVEKVLDVGTGTGILAMAAVLFGVESVLAIDNDPEAVRVAGENVAANGLTGHISVSVTDLADVRGPFSLIFANIVHDVLVEMAPQFKALLSPGGRVVLAGILTGEQEKNILQVYGGLGLHLQTSEHDGEWAALLLQRR